MQVAPGMPINPHQYQQMMQPPMMMQQAMMMGPNSMAMVGGAQNQQMRF